MRINYFQQQEPNDYYYLVNDNQEKKFNPISYESFLTQKSSQSKVLNQPIQSEGFKNSQREKLEKIIAQQRNDRIEKQRWQIDDQEILNFEMKEEQCQEDIYSNSVKQINVVVKYHQVNNGHIQYFDSLDQKFQLKINLTQKVREFVVFLEDYYLKKGSKIQLIENEPLKYDQSLKEIVAENEINLDVNLNDLDFKDYVNEQDMCIIPQNFETFPTFVDLCRMTKEQLKSLPNFQIKCDNTFITFLQPVNLIKADLSGLMVGDVNVSLRSDLKQTLFKYYMQDTLERYMEVLFTGVSDQLFRELKLKHKKIISLLKNEDMPNEFHFNEECTSIKIVY